MKVTAEVQTIGSFSVLSDKTIIPNGLPPRLNGNRHLYGTLKEKLDLKMGCEGFKDNEHEDGFDSLLEFISRTSEKGSSLKETIQADFIATPRILNALARSFNNVTPVVFRAIRRNDVIFLFDKDASNKNADSSIPCLQKFKQYMTLDQKGNPHTQHDQISDEATTTRTMNRMTLNNSSSNLKVVYTSKVDAIDTDKNFVELKTTALGHKKWVEKQSLRHYLQSFLANVQYAVYGRRVNIQEQKIFKVEKIPTRNIPNYNVTWKQEQCFLHLSSILQQIDSFLIEVDEAIDVNVTNGVVGYEEAEDNCTFVGYSFLNQFE